MSAKIIHSSLLTWRNCCLKHLKYRIHNAQNRRSGEISSCIFETYNNAVQPHGCHIYNTAADMTMGKMYPCISKHHGFLHCKFLLRCCENFPSIVLPSKEVIKDTTNTCAIIRFHVYHNFSRFTVHGQHPYHGKKHVHCFPRSKVPSSDSTVKLYTKK